MKNVVKSSKHFFGYFNTLKTHSEMILRVAEKWFWKIQVCRTFITPSKLLLRVQIKRLNVSKLQLSCYFFANLQGSGWSEKINAHWLASPNRKQANEMAIGWLLLSISVPEDQEESRLIGLEVLMALLGRLRFGSLYLRGPISNPRILEQR